MESERGLAQSEPRKLLRALAAAAPPCPPLAGGNLAGRACLSRQATRGDRQGLQPGLINCCVRQRSPLQHADPHTPAFAPAQTLPTNPAMLIESRLQSI